MQKTSPVSLKLGTPVLPLSRSWCAVAATVALLVAATNVEAQTVIIKADNADNLGLGSSWVGGGAPTSADVALWDATVLGGNTVSLGGDLNWSGIQITNPGGPITFNAGNSLTLGTSGIDMSAAVQDLTMDNGVILAADQSWNVATGRTLSVNGVISGAAGISKLGAGTLQLSTANSYTGPTVVSNGNLIISNNLALGSTLEGTSVNATTGGTLTLAGGLTISGETLTIQGERDGNLGALHNIGSNTWNGKIVANIPSGNTRISLANSSSLTINGDIETTGTGIFVFGGNGNATVNGVISGTGQLFRSSTGAGTVFLANANTHTGLSQISGGAFVLQHRNALQFSTVNVNVANGLKFEPGIGTFTIGGLTGPQTIAMTNTNGDAIVLEVGNNNVNSSYAGVLTGNGALVKIGTGTQSLTGASPAFTGDVTIKEGVLNINGSDRLGTGMVTIEAGGTLGASSNFNLTRPFTLAAVGAALSANSNVVFRIESLVTGNVGLTKRGLGTVTLMNSANNFTGTIRVLEGTLEVDTDFAQLGNPSNPIVLEGGILGVRSSLTLDRPVTLAAPGAGLGAVDTTTLTVNTLLQGSAGFRKTGLGSVVLANDANDFSGTVAIEAGGLVVSKNSQLGNPSNPIDFRGGFLRISESLTAARDITFTTANNNDSFRIAAGKTVEFTGALSGNGLLRVDDGNISSSSVYPNRTLILSGSGSNGTGNTVISTNSVLSFRGNTTLGSGNLTIQGNSVLELTDQVGNMTRTHGTLAGEIQLDTGVGAGFSARGANKIVSMGGIGTEQELVWNVTPKFIRDNANLIFGSPTANATVDFRNTLDLHAGTNGITRNILLVDGEAPGVSEAVFSGLIKKTGTGAVTLAFLGNGQIELNNPNNGAGGTAWTTIVKGGTLLLGADATSTPGQSVLSQALLAIQVGDTAALTANGYNAAAALLTNGPFNVTRGVQVNAGNAGLATFGGNADATSTFSGTITLNKDARLTSASTGANKLIVSGAISGVGKLTKIGAGVAEVSRSIGNDYTGGTEVSEGTLLVSNSTGSATGAGPVLVAPGATLGGSGFIAGELTVNGTLAPGLGAGVLTIQNTVNFAATSTLSLEITGTAAGAGGYDQLKMGSIAGGISLTSGAAINLTLGNFVPGASDVFFILTREDFGSFSTLFAGTTEGGLINLGNGYTGRITYLADWNDAVPGSSALTGGNDVAIYNVIPEPSSATMLMGGFAALAGWRRLRRGASRPV